MIRPLTCPVCDKSITGESTIGISALPFCSERCRKIDLFRWFDGRYAIVEELSEEQITDSVRASEEQVEDPEMDV